MSDTGHKLELSEATTKMAEAVVIGDPALLRTAADAHATALNSQATAMAASIAEPVYARLGSLTEQVRQLAEIVTNARQADLNWRTEERLTRDAQSTRLYVELDKLIAASEATARGLGKMEGEMGSLSDRMTAMEEAFSARPAVRAAEHQAIVEEIGGRVDQFGHELAEFKIAFAVFNASMLLSEHAVVVIDLSQIIVSVNRKVLDYFGYAADELVGQPLEMLLPARFRAAHRQHVQAFAESSDTQRLMADRHAVYGLHKDGTEFSIRAAIVKVPNGFTAVVERGA